MSDDGMTFRSSLLGISVYLTADALRTIERQATAAGNHETGGILIGSYDQDGRTATVREATSKSSDSRSGRTWFQRGMRGLKEVLQVRWSVGQYYIGEWHSHPGGAPEPSANDIREMRSVSTEISYQCPRPILIIAGTKVDASVRVSASVIDGGLLISLAEIRHRTVPN